MLIVGIAGGSGAGKTTLAKYLRQTLGEQNCSLLPLDAYYYDRSGIPKAERRTLNFDHPDSLEFSLLVSHLQQLKSGDSVTRPQYSYLSSTRLSQSLEVKPKPILLVEGILVLSQESLRKMLDIKVFVDVSEQQLLQRLIARDVEERGRSREEVLQRYREVVKPMYEQFIYPSRAFADLILSGNGEVEKTGLRLVQRLREQLPGKESNQ